MFLLPLSCRSSSFVDYIYEVPALLQLRKSEPEEQKAWRDDSKQLLKEDGGHVVLRKGRCSQGEGNVTRGIKGGQVPKSL